MEVRGGTINMVRGLPIDAALIGDVLVQLRRDALGYPIAWTLGNRGSADLDVEFFPVLSAANGALAEGAGPYPAWTTTARLWDRDGLAVLHSVVEVTAVSGDACKLTIRPAMPLTPWWSARMPALLDLAQAALDELAEELLWHATRERVT
jgi:hypothetical protein